MKNKELQELLKQFPDDLEVSINVPDFESDKYVTWYRKNIRVKEIKTNSILGHFHQLNIKLLR